MLSLNETIKDRYLLQSIIGQGGQALVYKALDIQTNTVVAVKSMRIKDKAEELENEVHIHRSMNHPNIIRYLNEVRSDSQLYIVMEYAENGSLQQLMKNMPDKRLGEENAAVYVVQVIAGLKYLHKKGVIQRDIKAANVLVDKHFNAKLSDFGLASFLDAPTIGKQDSPLVGSVYWMAPEVVRGEEITNAADLWSLGCLTIELITGNPPFYDRNLANALYCIAEGTEVPLPTGISPECTDFLRHCLEVNPKNRWSVAMLSQHPWIVTARRQQRTAPPFATHLVRSSASTPVEAIDKIAGTNSLIDGRSACEQEESQKDGLTAELEAVLFDDKRREEWLHKDGLKTVVEALSSAPPEDAFRVSRTLSFAVRALSGTDSFYFTALGETKFWDLDVGSLASAETLASLFIFCCACQDPSVTQFTPSHRKALQYVLQSEFVVQCAEALHYIVVEPPHLRDRSHKSNCVDNEDGYYRSGAFSFGQGGVSCIEKRPNSAIVDSSINFLQSASVAKRRESIRSRMLIDDCVDSFAEVLENVGVTSFNSEKDPYGGWDWVEKLFEIYDCLTEGVIDRNKITDRWIVTLKEAATHKCQTAIQILIKLVNERVGAIIRPLTVATFLNILVEPSIKIALKEDIMKAILVLQENNECAAMLANTDSSIPLLSLVTSVAQNKNSDLGIDELGIMCERRTKMAELCGSYPPLLNVVVSAFHTARNNSSSKQLAAVARLLKLMFAYTDDPLRYVNSSELIAVLVSIIRETTDFTPPAIKEVWQLLDALGAQHVMV